MLLVTKVFFNFFQIIEILIQRGKTEIGMKALLFVILEIRLNIIILKVILRYKFVTFPYFFQTINTFPTLFLENVFLIKNLINF